MDRHLKPLLGVIGAVLLAVASGAASGSGVRAGSTEPNFRIAYIHSNGEGTGKGKPRRDDVFVMNADGSAQRNLSRHPGLAGDPAWSPDGRRVAFVSRRDGKQEIYVVNADGSGLRNLTRSPEHEFAPAWSPDGRKIVFVRSRDYFMRADVELYVMNADGSSRRILTRVPSRHDGNPVWAGRAGWSPDGRKIGFAPKRDGDFDVYVMNADGSGQRNMTRNSARDFFYAWLPDGRIAFHSERGGASQLYVMNADGSGLRNLTREWKLTFSPVWSPSGGKIAFVLDRSLYVMNADGSGRRKVAERAGFHPAWSPDGRKLAFTRWLVSWARGSTEIFVVNADGGGERRLTRRPGHDYGPVWSPARTN